MDGSTLGAAKGAAGQGELKFYIMTKNLLHSKAVLVWSVLVHNQWSEHVKSRGVAERQGAVVRARGIDVRSTLEPLVFADHP